MNNWLFKRIRAWFWRPGSRVHRWYWQKARATTECPNCLKEEYWQANRLMCLTCGLLYCRECCHGHPVNGGVVLTCPDCN